MKKSFYLVIAFFVFAITNAQISVSAKGSGRKGEIEPENFKKFKATTTIFVLSDIYSKEQYEEVLKKSWNVTPYLIIPSEEFDAQKYLSDKYSFAVLSAYSVNKKATFFLHSSVSVFIYDTQIINNEIEKVKAKTKEKKREEKVNELIAENIIHIAKFELFCNTDMLKIADEDYKLHRSSMTSDFTNPNSIFYRNVTSFNLNKKNLSKYEKEMLNFTFKKKTFKNYTLGMLKNYFQRINSGISKEEIYGMYDVDATSELKNLKKETLYIPDYNKVTYKPMKIRDEVKSEKDLKELFEDYKYKYAFISENELDEKIAKEENFYYLRYVKINNQKFFHIINGKTGEVIYRDYEAGLGTYNIESGDFKKLSKEIAK